MTDGCPCGHPSGYAEHCGRLHAGAPAQTAEAVMRARYTANVVGDHAFLLATWDPDTRPDDAEVTHRTADIEWLGLRVLRTERGGALDADGVVEFVARYQRRGGPPAELHEISRFRRHGTRWIYVDGTLPLQPAPFDLG